MAMMREDFCAFILTHGRPDRVHTYTTLRNAGYTGKIYIVIDDEDKTESEYRKRYGDEVLQFCKEEIAKTFDEGDNFNDRRAIIYARNACCDLAKQVGCKYFIHLDDDYTHFNVRFKSDGSPCNGMIHKMMDDVLCYMLDFYISIPALSIAMSQGGDFIGGATPDKRKLTRKVMNSFICSTERPFQFFGRVNEDVNTYTTTGRNGGLFFTVMQAFMNQEVTQKGQGGMTEMYIDSGTYVKSFYSVMYCPSGVKVGKMGDPRSPHYRLHHQINWNRVAPKILRETHRREYLHG
jgi:hypothetical protein